MKIAFENVNFNSFTGPNQFGQVLATELQHSGINICSTQADDYDLCLTFIEQHNELKKKVPLIQRLDGIYFANKDEFDTKNVFIRETYNKADGLIFQSEFDKKMIEKHFGTRDVPKVVIHNGTYVRRLTNAEYDQIEWLKNIRQDFVKIFVCSSQWKDRPNKRFDDNIRLVYEYSEWAQHNCCLISMGESDKMKANSEVRYSNKFYQLHLGNVIPSQAWIPVSIADWFIHLAYLDHCPNVMVQALACETAVICSSAGGQAELAHGRGLIIQDKECEYEIENYREPPSLSFSDYHFKVIRNGYRLRKDQVEDLHIKNVAQKYIEFFKGFV